MKFKAIKLSALSLLFFVAPAQAAYFQETSEGVRLVCANTPWNIRYSSTGKFDGRKLKPHECMEIAIEPLLMSTAGDLFIVVKSVRGGERVLRIDSKTHDIYNRFIGHQAEETLVSPREFLPSK